MGFSPYFLETPICILKNDNPKKRWLSDTPVANLHRTVEDTEGPFFFVSLPGMIIGLKTQALDL